MLLSAPRPRVRSLIRILQSKKSAATIPVLAEVGRSIRNVMESKNMAYYNKIGLLVLNDDQTKFLVCEPGERYKEKVVTQYLMPGGQLEEQSDVECLQAEIKEELDCDVKVDSLQLIGKYTDVAATPGRDVMIRLYKGNLIGRPKPSTEIGALHWIGKADQVNPRVSPIIRNKIIPDLATRGILR